MLGVQFTHRLPLSSTTFPHLPRVPLSNTTRTSPITFCEQIIIVVHPLSFLPPHVIIMAWPGAHFHHHHHHHGGGGFMMDPFMGGGGPPHHMFHHHGGGGGFFDRPISDREKCQFFVKMGACRHGDKCTKLHIRPSSSVTIMLPMMYLNPKVVPLQTTDEATGKTINIDYDKKFLKNHVHDFFEEVFLMMMEFGRVQEMYIVDNLCDHLLGNVYVKFETDVQAQAALEGLKTHAYNGVVLTPELCPVVEFGDAACKEDRETDCKRGLMCNYLHIIKISSSLMKHLVKKQNELYGPPQEVLAMQQAAEAADRAAKEAARIAQQQAAAAAAIAAAAAAQPPQPVANLAVAAAPPPPPMSSSAQPHPTSSDKTAHHDSSRSDRHGDRSDRHGDHRSDKHGDRSDKHGDKSGKSGGSGDKVSSRDDKGRRDKRGRSRTRSRSRGRRDKSRDRRPSSRDKNRRGGSRGRGRSRSPTRAGPSTSSSGRPQVMPTTSGGVPPTASLCHICGEVGHISRDCPMKNQK